MKNIKKLSIVKGALTLFTMFVSGGLLYAQDVILDGPAGCNAAANSGSWTVPCDVTSISVELYGGGGGAGGGGGGSNGGVFNTSAGGGGGGGGYSTITLNVIRGQFFHIALHKADVVEVTVVTSVMGITVVVVEQVPFQVLMLMGRPLL